MDMKLKNLFIYGIILLFGFVCFTTGYYSNKSSAQIVETQPDAVIEKRLKENFKFINPLLECDSEIGNSKQLRPLSEQLNKYINQMTANNTISTAGVYYREDRKSTRLNSSHRL